MVEMRRYLGTIGIVVLLGLGGAPGVSAAPAWREVLGGWHEKVEDVLVVEVRSADTLVLENREVIRLIGLKAPPVPRREHPRRDEHGFFIKEDDPTVSVEERALRFVRELLEGRRVRLEYDEELKDEDFRTWAYVFVPGPKEVLANAEILRRGYADLRILPPNTRYADRLRAAYQEARREKRGVHAR